MKCPFCGGEMEEGRLISRGYNYFLPSGERPPWTVIPPKSSLEKKNAVLLPPDRWEVPPNWPQAHCCRKCRKILIDY